MQVVNRFYAIEGLRGYLAWAVVVDHIAYWSGFRGPLGELMRGLGMPAVECFMIISGFVITHLIVERPEPYRYYLTRRCMRIFPLFAITCVLGYFVYHLPLLVPDFETEFATVIRGVVSDTKQYFWAHVVAHATMLYGVVSDDVLPSSQYAFNMAAWTISLEWQFYVLAPFIVVALRERRAIVVVAFAAAFFVTRTLLQRHWFGSYSQPSFLPEMAEFFAIGIACRLIYPHLVKVRLDWSVALAGVTVFFVMTRHRALTLWLAVYLGLLIEQPPVLYRLALESPLARYFGSRSYSAFLSHFIVLNVVVWQWYLWRGTAPSFAPLLLLAAPVTIALSELLYRCVEKPGIALGTRLCERPISDGVSVVYRSYGSTP